MTSTGVRASSIAARAPGTRISGQQPQDGMGVEQLTDSERRALLAAADVEDGGVRAGGLDGRARSRLVLDALRDVAG